MYVSKNVLNHYLVHSSAFNGLKSAKNIVFFSFCILVNMPRSGSYSLPPPAPPGYATVCLYNKDTFTKGGLNVKLFAVNLKALFCKDTSLCKYDLYRLIPIL